MVERRRYQGYYEIADGTGKKRAPELDINMNETMKE
jgi:hypothetical protein